MKSQNSQCRIGKSFVKKISCCIDSVYLSMLVILFFYVVYLIYNVVVFN